jgi:hypothetical protein
MNSRLIRALAAGVLALAAGTAAATDIGVSVSIGQPNFYGRIDLNNDPKPVLIYPQPVVIQPLPAGVYYAPVYLRVPPGHAKDWRKHCGKYDACGRPVYFVKDDWYENVYVPAYEEHHGKGKGKGNGNGKGKGKKDD